MRWPWARQASNERLILSWSDQTLSYVHARTLADGSQRLLNFGVESQGTDSTEVFIARLLALGLDGLKAEVMLRADQYQFLTIEAPAVPDEELHSAAGYQVKGMLKGSVDSVTLDVMRLGNGQQDKQPGQLFVVAADSMAMDEIVALSDAMNWNLRLIDVQETAQRNLQSNLAGADGRANAALVSSGENSMILTISANGALFYARRYKLPKQPLAEPSEYETDMFSRPTDIIRPLPSGAEEVADYGPNDDNMQRFLLKVQRSLDIWNRSWASMPIDGIQVYAGERSAELSAKFSLAFGQTSVPMDVSSLFPEFDEGIESEKALCMPLLGILIRAPTMIMPQSINLLTQLQVMQKGYFLAHTMVRAMLVFLLVISGLSSYWLSRIESAGEEARQAISLKSLEFESLQGDIALSESGSKMRSALVRELEAGRAELLQQDILGRAQQHGRFSPGWGHGARLRLVAETIPTQVWVTEMVGDTSQFEIRGFTLTPTALGGWVAVLNASPLFEGQRLSDVNLENTSTEILNKARPVWSFSLFSQITKPSPAPAVNL